MSHSSFGCKLLHNERPWGAVASAVDSATNFTRWGSDAGSRSIVSKLLLENSGWEN